MVGLRVRLTWYASIVMSQAFGIEMAIDCDHWPNQRPAECAIQTKASQRNNYSVQPNKQSQHLAPTLTLAFILHLTLCCEPNKQLLVCATKRQTFGPQRHIHSEKQISLAFCLRISETFWRTIILSNVYLWRSVSRNLVLHWERG